MLHVLPGHCSRDWGPRTTVFIVLSFLGLFLGWYVWFRNLLFEFMGCTSVFINWICLSADSSDFAICRALLKVSVFPSLTHSFLTQSVFIPRTRKQKEFCARGKTIEEVGVDNVITLEGAPKLSPEPMPIAVGYGNAFLNFT